MSAGEGEGDHGGVEVFWDDMSNKRENQINELPINRRAAHMSCAPI